LKPFYEGIAVQRPFEKNCLFRTREELLEYAGKYGTKAMIVQRVIRGGDGHIFDCYGYCDADGRVLTMATHRRLRQSPPDFGSTCFGEIPANFGAATDARLIANTERLLDRVRYHGIFGIEWLHERESDNFYLIDFNARPFTTIGHLHDCGLNLPMLAYLDLTGQLPAHIARFPVLEHRLWMDLIRDIETLHSMKPSAWTTIRQWLATVWRCHSYAYQSWRDPLPGVFRIFAIATKLLMFLRKRWFNAG
jgi:predicted ATP-grasp superfamily ATP-dependent carboligase